MKLDLKAEHTVYKNASGKRLTGVTTYLSAIAKPQLLKWYADEERKGVMAAMLEHFDAHMEDKPGPLVLPKVPFAELKRDKAADVGTVTHARIEAFLKDDELERDGIPDEAWQASEAMFEEFKQFWDSMSLTLVRSEHVMVASIDTDNGPVEYGGTADIIARNPQGRLVLIDIKTSKKSRYWPYPEVYAQVAAYCNAYRNTTGDPIDDAVVIRLDREGGGVQIVRVSSERLYAGWRMFLGAHQVYEFKKELERSKDTEEEL